MENLSQTRDLGHSLIHAVNYIDIPCGPICSQDIVWFSVSCYISYSALVYYKRQQNGYWIYFSFGSWNFQEALMGDSLPLKGILSFCHLILLYSSRSGFSLPFFHQVPVPKILLFACKDSSELLFFSISSPIPLP